jgi:hypothetical protein
MRFLLTFLIIFFCISCEKKATIVVKKKPVAKAQFAMNDFAGKVFKISSKVDKNTCTVYSDGCDCCEGKMVFLKDGRFVSDFYCIPYNEYTAGTYAVTNGKLEIKCYPVTSSFGPINESEPGSKDTLIAYPGDDDPVFLEIYTCGKKPILKAEADYYAEDKTISVEQAVSEYKKSGVWDILGMQ